MHEIEQRGYSVPDLEERYQTARSNVYRRLNGLGIKRQDGQGDDYITPEQMQRLDKLDHYLNNVKGATIPKFLQLESQGRLDLVLKDRTEDRTRDRGQDTRQDGGQLTQYVDASLASDEEELGGFEPAGVVLEALAFRVAQILNPISNLKAIEEASCQKLQLSTAELAQLLGTSKGTLYGKERYTSRNRPGYEFIRTKSGGWKVGRLED